MEAKNLTAVLNDLGKESRFAKLNKRSENFSRLIKILIKTPYLVLEDKLVAFLSRRLAVHLSSSAGGTGFFKCFIKVSRNL